MFSPCQFQATAWTDSSARIGYDRKPTLTKRFVQAFPHSVVWRASIRSLDAWSAIWRRATGNGAMPNCATAQTSTWVTVWSSPSAVAQTHLTNVAADKHFSDAASAAMG